MLHEVCPLDLPDLEYERSGGLRRLVVGAVGRVCGDQAREFDGRSGSPIGRAPLGLPGLGQGQGGDRPEVRSQARCPPEPEHDAQQWGTGQTGLWKSADPPVALEPGEGQPQQDGANVLACCAVSLFVRSHHLVTHSPRLVKRRTHAVEVRHAG